MSLLYLGAKHIVTGYDHILFLLDAIFFLYRMKDIGIYVSLFAIGHSTPMLAGVFLNFGINHSIIVCRSICLVADDATDGQIRALVAENP